MLIPEAKESVAPRVHIDINPFRVEAGNLQPQFET